MGGQSGRVAYHNGDKQIFIFPDEEIPDGFIKGGNPCDRKVVKQRINTRQQNGISSPTKGKHCYNNGVTEKYFFDGEEIPDGYSKGRLKSSIQNALDGHTNKDWNKCGTLTGRTAYCNGDKIIYLNDNDEVPDGFTKRGLPKTEDWKKQQSEIQKSLVSIHNGNTRTRINLDKVNMPEGFEYGFGNYHTDEWKKKQSKILSSKKVQAKRYKTVTKNKTFTTSKPEEILYKELCEQYGEDNVVRQYMEERYPFKCDFYIKSNDLFIELNRHWTHGGRPFDPMDDSCKEQLKHWKKKAKKSKFYKTAIRVWTQLDVMKRETAKRNKLNYEIIW